ncbi:uncharacterized protein METZ01_LOCUS369391, partial [marine metagenome]
VSSPSDQEFEVRRPLVQMQMLYEVGLAMSESLDPSFVAEQVLHRALAMVDARAGALLVCDSDETIPPVRSVWPMRWLPCRPLMRSERPGTRARWPTSTAVMAKFHDMWPSSPF